MQNIAVPTNIVIEVYSPVRSIIINWCWIWNVRESINTIGLDGVLYFLGFKDSYLDEKAQ